jgi:site-specific recombinase XerD
LRKIQRGSASQPERWMTEFADSLRREDLSATTVCGYLHDLTLFVRWYEQAIGEKLRLEKLTPIDLINYRQSLIKVQGLKPATINRRLEALRRLCRWAHQQKMLTANIAQELKPVRAARGHPPKGLTDPEVHALLRAAGESRQNLAKRNYALVQLMLQAGLRVSEVSALNVSDVRVRDRSGAVRIRHGKGRQEREVPLNATARRALHSYLDSRGEVKESEPFFLSSQAQRMPERTIQAVISQLARRAKITRLAVSAHALRHTFALNYLRQNPGKLVELASLLGHESLDTTAIYTRPSEEDLAADLERSRLNVYG